ncbi:MAG TPA: extracellular solute-binding protein [Thermoleophilaceae bacterium]|jgi:multiple sugar transport system substrate-binding protein
MRRSAAVVAMILAAAIGVAACGGGGGGGGSKTTATADLTTPVTLTVWSGFSERELGIWNSVLAGFHKLHPAVKIKSVGAVDNNKIVAAIRGGNPPDVALSFETDKTGAFCSSGGWIDLTPYINRDHVDISQFPPAVQTYTKFENKRCAMPDLADVYGIYYNKGMLQKAGITAPPKNYTELLADAKKLTVRNSDGSIKVAGFIPNEGFYENAAAHWGPLWDAKWTDAQGKSTLATSPGWGKWLTWDKQLIDWYGYDKLKRFIAGAGQEFSASNAFESGKVAMIMDGEYRTAFIKAEHPNLDYGTAPMPVDDAQPNIYGGGYVVGNTLGIPKGAKHTGQAWELIKYLSTNTKALTDLAEGLGNVPTTPASSKATNLNQDPHFQPFLKIFTNPNTQTNPIVASGDADQLLFHTFIENWEAGKVSDLQKGLQGVDKQIDAQLANATAGSAP